MATISSSLTATGAGGVLGVKAGDSLTYGVTGTWVGTVVLERSDNNGASWDTLVSSTANVSTATYENLAKNMVHLRWRCSAFTSGTIVTSLADVAVATGSLGPIAVTEDGASVTGTLAVSGTATFDGSVVRAGRQLSVNAAGKAKVGATAGWVVAAADNIALVTCPASQTASTLVLPLHNLNVGDTITGFNLVGQIESAGGAVTVDCALRKHTAAAADVADASVGAITQVSVTADTILSSSNAGKTGLTEVVGVDETFYLLITATTAASTDIALQGAVITITEA